MKIPMQVAKVRAKPVKSVEIGQRFGRLMVTGVRPFLMLCDCGMVVINRKPYHVAHNRLRSCGCLKRERIDIPHTSDRWSSIQCVNPDEKVRFQRFAVTCSRCAAPSVVCYESVTSSAPSAGCKLCCAHAVRSREVQAEKARRAAAKAAAE